MLLSVLFRPWSYLSIRPRHKQKIMTDWGFPVILSGLSMLALFYCSDLSNIFSTGGIVEKITTFIQTLPGFYLAALSAIATFNKPDMDQYMVGIKLEADILLAGQKERIQLTRRRFLCIMFAFLTMQSFIISLIGIVLPLNSIIEYPEWLTLCTCGLFFFLVWQLLMVTLWGLYYLGERMHTPNN